MPKKNQPAPWCPDKCPITGREFFMWIDHPENGMVPTYGGPFDSFTLCEPDGDGTFHCERYDHDAGHWTDAWEWIDLRLIDGQREDHEHGTVEELQAEIARLNAMINTPHTDEWFEAVRLEAAHQIERWGTAHDAGKQPADWFWLLGYLGQKAMTSAMAGDETKARHHTISSGAMLLNWFRAMVRDSTAMRPGMDLPERADEANPRAAQVDHAYGRVSLLP